MFSSTRRAAWTRWLTSSRAMFPAPRVHRDPVTSATPNFPMTLSYVAGFDIGGKS